MPNTYTQLLIQFVFAVKYRDAVIRENVRPRVESYLSALATKYGHKPLAIYCMPDHCHFLLGLNPIQSPSNCARILKANSARKINKAGIIAGNFRWQEGYGAFSYGRSQLNEVVQYIRNQALHHRNKNFKNEYWEFLEKFEVPYEEAYLFEDLK